MQLIGAIILFIVFIFVYLIIVEIFVMLFRITGLTDEKARFQVISMLTNSGYTTKEAELIVNSRRRRKLARFVMMFGYAFTVTVVSTVVNLFLQFRAEFTGSVVALVPIIAIIIFVCLLVKNNKKTSSIIDSFIKKVATMFVYDDKTNPIFIIDDYGHVVIARIELKVVPNIIKDVKLCDSDIKRKHGINILLKDKNGEKILPEGDTTFSCGDTLVVMGREKEIRTVFGIGEIKFK